jgi:hypothetical protein
MKNHFSAFSKKKHQKTSSCQYQTFVTPYPTPPVIISSQDKNSFDIYNIQSERLRRIELRNNQLTLCGLETINTLAVFLAIWL